MQKLREKLNMTLMNEHINSDYVLALSVELDQLILEYYKKKH
jgi:hypothetical protein